jgi:hypothetical protein
MLENNVGKSRVICENYLNIMNFQKNKEWFEILIVMKMYKKPKSSPVLSKPGFV